MLVLIDESGDTGFKLGSSRYFVITMVVFPESDGQGRYPEAEKTANAIRQAAITARHKKEFHFKACSHQVRSAFFKELNQQNCQFDIYTLIIDKQKIESHQLKTHPKQFYNFFVKQILTHNPIYGAVVKIDGSKSREFRKEFASYLRRGEQGMLKECKFQDSEKDVLIQLADMVCGAIAFELNRQDILNAKEYRIRLGKRIKGRWEFQ